MLLCDASPDDPAWTVATVAEALGVTPRTIEHLKKKFVGKGLEAALVRKPRGKPPRDVIFDGANELKSHLSKYWKISPKGNAAFVAALEDTLEVYQLPHDLDYPFVCMDESSKQLVGEVHTPIPCKPGQSMRMDDEYVRSGVVEWLADAML